MTATLHLTDWILIGSYFVSLIWLSWYKGWIQEDEEHFLLSGRKVTLPAFVATLVSTWYGGILGVGEYSYQFGISQWLILGMPFYVFSALFAIFLAGKIRLNKALSIPEAVAFRYGEKAGRLSALPIFVLVSPAPYILMLGLLFQFLSGGQGPFLLYAGMVALFAVLYVTVGGFGAVVRTDILQVILMFGGFILLIFYAASQFGPIGELWEVLPENHRDPTGGQSWQYILVWFFIALWTFVDPSFHQRAAAAESPQTARRGIFISILFWAGFDFLTAFSGLYGWAILGPDISEPILVYPMMAETLLPMGLKGLFFVSLLATMMSTLDSYLFLSGQTLGRDFLVQFFPRADRNRLTRMSTLIAALLGIILIFLYPSVIDLWYVLGSVFIPGLLIPILGIYLPLFRIKTGYVFASMIGATGVSLAWLIMGTLYQTGEPGYAFMNIEPFYPGLLLAGILWLAGRDNTGSHGFEDVTEI
ncbi:MAG: sodium:solute symporter family protein [Balneolaceae bacterium]